MTPSPDGESSVRFERARAGSEASDKFSARYGLSVGVVIFNDVFVTRYRASACNLPCETATESAIGLIFCVAPDQLEPAARSGHSTKR